MKYVSTSIGELSDTQVLQYVHLFNETFDHNLSKEALLQKFSNMGTSTYFAFLLDDNNTIIGSLGAIEVPYVIGSRQYQFALAVDGMIASGHRLHPLTLKILHDLLISELEKRGIIYIFTKPNQNSYDYLKTILDYEDIGVLNVHCFPLRPLRTPLRLLAPANDLWKFLVQLTITLISRRQKFIPISIEQVELAVAFGNDASIYRPRDLGFLKTRYQASCYKAVGWERHAVVYTIHNRSGRNICFVMEATNLSFSGWLAFVKYVCSEHPDIDLVMRIVGQSGYLWPLVPVPRRFLPKKFNVIGRPIGDNAIPENANFRLDLSDFEVL